MTQQNVNSERQHPNSLHPCALLAGGRWSNGATRLLTTVTLTASRLLLPCPTLTGFLWRNLACLRSTTAIHSSSLRWLVSTLRSNCSNQKSLIPKSSRSSVAGLTQRKMSQTWKWSSSLHSSGACSLPQLWPSSGTSLPWPILGRELRIWLLKSLELKLRTQSPTTTLLAPSLHWLLLHPSSIRFT